MEEEKSKRSENNIDSGKKVEAAHKKIMEEMWLLTG